LDKLRVAVIGCGFWGKNHARIYNDLDETELVAVSDLNEDAACSLGDKYGVNYYNKIDALLSRSDIDMISICTPTVTHAKIALEAMEAGKHVLVEKPMTSTVKEAKKLIETSKRAGVKLTVGFVERFNPGVIEALKLVREGKIGEVILARAHRVSRYPLRISDVGVVKDLAIHDADIVRQLFDAEPETVYATAGNLVHTFEDYANIVLRFPDKKSAFIETNWITPHKIRRLILTGSGGLITVEFITQEVTVEDDEGRYQPFLQPMEPLTLELQSFVGSIIKDTPPVISGEDGLKALMICEAALESARTGTPVRL
jgi:UDP-N-acetylglucosamine 3-dehydrogenase